MEIKFQIQGGHSFNLEVDPSETIRNVKEKVLNSQHIPIARQIFLYHYEFLPDDMIVSQCGVKYGGCIVLQIRADPEAPPPTSDSDSDFRPPTPEQQPTPKLQLPSPSDMQTSQVIPNPYDPLGKRPMTQDISSASNKMVEEELEESFSRRVTLSLKARKYWTHHFPMEANLDETVLKLKKSILQKLRILAGFEMDNVPVERMVLHSHSTGAELLDHQLLRDCAVSDNHEINLSVKEP